MVFRTLQPLPLHMYLVCKTGHHPLHPLIDLHLNEVERRRFLNHYLMS